MFLRNLSMENLEKSHLRDECEDALVKKGIQWRFLDHYSTTQCFQHFLRGEALLWSRNLHEQWEALLQNEQLENRLRTHLCPPFLGASLAACFGWISNFELCSQSIPLPCSSTTLCKNDLGRNINSITIIISLQNKSIQLRNSIKNLTKDAFLLALL